MVRKKGSRDSPALMQELSLVKKEACAAPQTLKTKCQPQQPRKETVLNGQPHQGWVGETSYPPERFVFQGLHSLASSDSNRGQRKIAQVGITKAAAR